MKIFLGQQGKPSAFMAAVNIGEISVTVFRSVSLLEVISMVDRTLLSHC